MESLLKRIDSESKREYPKPGTPLETAAQIRNKMVIGYYPKVLLSEVSGIFLSDSWVKEYAEAWEISVQESVNIRRKHPHLAKFE